MKRIPSIGRAILTAIVLLASGGVLQPQLVHADACTPPVTNAIACENTLTGTPKTTWDTSLAGDPALQGFTTDISYNVGTTVSFKVTAQVPYRIDIYRLGYYAGNGARSIASVTQTTSVAQSACQTDVTTGLVDCGNWSVTATWAIPSTAVSGVYLGRLTYTDGSNNGTLVPFIVRNDASHSDLVFQTSDTTWQAYNQFGGASLYQGNGPGGGGRAFKVSYNRPFATRGQAFGFGPNSYLFYDEFPMIRFLESNGYNMSYISGVDTDRQGVAQLETHKVFLSVGHDEYWSGSQRTNLETARDAGLNLAFFSGNSVFWKTRYEASTVSTDGSPTAYRTLVSYKDTHTLTAGDASKPLDPVAWTGSWRDPRRSPPEDGGRPENALQGTIFNVNAGNSTSLMVPSDFANLRFWRNTAVAGLTTGALSLGTQTVGYEWDVDQDNGFRPAGLIDLSSTTVNVNQQLKDFGSTYGNGSSTHKLTLYRASSGALVFGAGSVQWSWGLDAVHDTANDTGGPADKNMQQATVNLLADMSAQPSTLVAGLVAASKSTNTTPPTSTITSPAVGGHVTAAVTATIAGTASSLAGTVGGVEVSVDGGTTWHPAVGTANWTYTWRVGNASGAAVIKSRAIDDSGNIETPGAGVSVTIDPSSCGCSSIFLSSDSPAPQGAPDTLSVEVGVKFHPDVNGYIDALRFYKLPSNTGAHTASLWSSTGQLVGQTTFTNETASGWQQVNFTTPIAVTANTEYVASYHAPNGGYASDLTTFGYAGIDNSPVHANKNLASDPNGVYAYSGGPVFPTNTYNAANYWVDVVFSTVAIDKVPPAVTGFTPSSTATNLPLDAPITVTFNKNVQPSTIVVALKDPNGSSVATNPLTYNAANFVATVQPAGPLELATKYTATVSGVKDTAGNQIAAPTTWSFTTPTCPCSFWNSTATPVEASHGDPTAVEVGMHFKPEVPGFVTGLSFFKGSINTGTHIGHLWSGAGTQLASVTFAGETPGGWQTASFPTPVAVNANTDYVISYHTDAGNYAVTNGYFNTSATDVGPLLAPANAQNSPNGVYLYSASPGAFPTNTFGATNYWVDVTFAPSIAAGGPRISAIQATSIDQNNEHISWTTDKLSDSQVDYGLTTTYTTSTLETTSMVTAHSVALTGLTPNTLYHFRVKSKDGSGNLAVSADSTFTTLESPHSLSLNGTTAYAEAPSASKLNVVGDWTVEAWFKDTSPNGYYHTPAVIVSKGDSVNNSDVPYSVGIAFGALFVSEKANGVFSYVYYDLVNHQVSANAWHHVAISVSGSTRQATMYLDGVQVVQGTLSVVTAVGNSAPLSIGRNGGPTGYGNFQGLIDDVRIWNSVRTASQVGANYKTEFATSPTGLVGSWKFNEGFGATAVDFTATPDNATLNGGATFSSDVHP